MMNTSDNAAALKGRVRGMLYGIAYGDAMGGPVEKLSADEISARYGRVTSIHNRWHRLDEEASFRNGRTRGHGIITDDTLMTLCLMEVYQDLGRHLDAWDMAGPFVRKIAWEPRWVPELDREALLIERLFYPEKWIFQRLQLAACDPRQGGIGNMVNCGAAMYAAPIGAANAGAPRAAYDEAIAFMSGHQQSYGLEAAGVFAACIAEAFRPDASVASVVHIASQLAKDGTKNAVQAALEVAHGHKGTRRDYRRLVSDLHSAMQPFSPMGDDVRHGPEKAGVATAGYQPSRLLSIEELPLALAFCVANDGDFVTAIEDGINSGRDTDSIGVMAGAILGVLHGGSVIDVAAQSHLNETNRIDLNGAADAFTAAILQILTDDLEQAERRRVAVAALTKDASVANQKRVGA